MKSNELTIDNWQKGITQSPHLDNGFADMRNVNVVTQPGVAMVGFKTASMTLPPAVNAVAYTTNVTTNVLTVSSTSGWYNSMAITLDTVVTSTGISTGRVYWVGDLSGNTFKLYKGPSLHSSLLVDITGSNGSGTLTSYTMSAPLDKAIDYDTSTVDLPARLFILDDNGRVWWVKNTEALTPGLTTSVVYLGNDTLTSSGNRAIALWKDYLIVFRSSAVDALSMNVIDGITDLDSASGWIYAFDNRSSITGVARRAVLVGQDDILYFQNGSNRIGSYTETSGDFFDPSDGASFAENIEALTLPAGHNVLEIGEMGQYLLLGTNQNTVYPWDRSSTSFNLPIILPERGTSRIVSGRQVAYVFAGNRGRIYAINGSQVKLYKKIPDYLTGTIEPYITWGDAMGWKNQLYFSFTSYKNDNTALNNTGGVWAIDTESGTLRHSMKLSYDTYGGTASVIAPHVLAENPPGYGMYIGWSNGSTYGVDITSTSVYSNYEAYIDTALHPIGTKKSKRSFTQLEIQLVKPLVTNQGVKVSYRTNLTSSFTLLTTFDYATNGGAQSVVADVAGKLKELEFIQLRIELDGTSDTSPELRYLILR